MKIMQLNVWQGRLIGRILKFIEDEDPDIILTQEMFSFPEPVKLRSPWNYIGLLEHMAAQNHLHTYLSPGNTFPMFGNTVSYGNAILSKFPLEHTVTQYTSGDGPVHFDNPATFDGNVSQTLQHVRVNTGRTTLNVLNHHGRWQPNPTGDDMSGQKLLKIADYINELEDPVIFGGDLNLSPTSPAIAGFKQAVHLEDLVAGTHPTTTLSEAHYIKNVACDYLFASPGLTATSVRISDELVSDHRAVIAEVDC